MKDYKIGDRVRIGLFTNGDKFSTTVNDVRYETGDIVRIVYKTDHMSESGDWWCLSLAEGWSWCNLEYEVLPKKKILVC